jgi:hypothetical protein
VNAVSLNPASVGGAPALARSPLCRRHGLALEESGAAEELARRARRAVEEGVERLLVAGGDGSWHWAAQGLAGGGTALAPIPLGTGNDLARELGYPLDPECAFAAALDGARDRIDLGRIDPGPERARYFCGVAGVGFDAAVAEYARTRVRWLRGPLVYAWATLASLAPFRPPRATLEVAGGGSKARSSWWRSPTRRTTAAACGSRPTPIHATGCRRGRPPPLFEAPPVARLPEGLRRAAPRRSVRRGSRGRQLRLAISPPQWINADGEGSDAPATAICWSRWFRKRWR